MGREIKVKKTVSRIVLTSFIIGILFMTINLKSVNPWSNGGYSSDPDNPEYGTHDWIAQHALDFLPIEEKQYILNNLAAYLYGTELPDNGVAPDGIGDTFNHHAYFNESEIMVDDWAAFRANWESERVMFFLKQGDPANAAKIAGIMSHYLADVAVFGHVMAANSPWGAEQHHADYETYVNTHTSNYTADFNSYLSFDGVLDVISAYNATKNLAYDTTFDADGDLTCVWMDQNYNWSNLTFKDRAGESLNLAVNLLADILHTIYTKTLAGEKLTVFPAHDVGLLFANVTAEGPTTVNKTASGPTPPQTRVVKLYYDIETTANYSDKIDVKIIYGASKLEELSLQLAQWNETAQQWTNITTYIDVKNNLVVGETTHLSIFGVTCLPVPPESTCSFQVDYGSDSFNVSVKTNSAITNLAFDQPNKTVSFDVDGENSTQGFCNITMPETLLGGPYIVKIDNKTILNNYTPPTNGTHSFLFFTYIHSFHTVEIIGTTAIPEFQSFIILPLFIVSTLLLALLYRRRTTPR